MLGRFGGRLFVRLSEDDSGSFYADLLKCCLIWKCQLAFLTELLGEPLAGTTGVVDGRCIGVLQSDCGVSGYSNCGDEGGSGTSKLAARDTGRRFALM